MMHRSHSLAVLAQAEGSPLQTRKTLTGSDALRKAATRLVDDRKEESYERFRKSDSELSVIKSKKVRRFYEAQNELLDLYREVDNLLDGTVSDTNGDLESSPLLPKGETAKDNRADSGSPAVKWAILINLLINIGLVAAKLVVALLSNSISLLASTIDSALDLISTILIYATSRMMSHTDWDQSDKFPTGKSRLEPLTIVIFSVFMQASFIQVFIESIQRLFDKHLEIVNLSHAAVAIMASTVVVKLVVFLWYRSWKNSSIRALSQDAQNDVVFNLFSLLFPLIGSAIGTKYLDPIGGALLSIYIIVDWAHTLVEHTIKLCGRRASPIQHSRVIYLVTRFSKLVRKVQHASVYHSGDDFIAEIDLIVPSDLSLKLAHNLGESVQMSLESLQGVQRAYCHVDYHANPATGHQSRS